MLRGPHLWSLRILHAGDLQLGRRFLHHLELVLHRSDVFFRPVPVGDDVWCDRHSLHILDAVLFWFVVQRRELPCSGHLWRDGHSLHILDAVLFWFVVQRGQLPCSSHLWRDGHDLHVIDPVLLWPVVLGRPVWLGSGVCGAGHPLWQVDGLDGSDTSTVLRGRALLRQQRQRLALVPDDVCPLGRCSRDERRLLRWSRQGLGRTMQPALPRRWWIVLDDQRLLFTELLPKWSLRSVTSVER